MSSLESMCKVSRGEFISKIDDWLIYHRSKIRMCVDDWNYYDDYDDFEAYFNDADNGEFEDDEGILDMQVLIGMPKVIGDFYQKYAEVLKTRYLVFKDYNIDEYIINNVEDFDNMSFNILKKTEEGNMERVKELEEYIESFNCKVNNTDSLYI